LFAAIPRILGAFFLPNAFGDAYVYVQEIGTLTTKISSGSFRLTDLFGFWLPLYQLIAALVNVLVKNGFYSGKIVAAIFGAGACLFVYLVTQRLTNNETAALWTFLLIALNPLHIFYSASAMTDVPHAFLVVASLYFVFGGNWIMAAIFAALAGFTRVESWMLIALLPFIQFVKERRISVVTLVILSAPPLLWFFISRQATGNWLACFVQRQQYHDWLLRMNPAIAHFSLVNAAKDAATLLVSSDVAVLIASFVAGWFFLTRDREWVMRGNKPKGPDSILTPLLFFFAFFTLLVVAYLTHQQPIIFPRYGLILFTIGLPILAWTLLKIRAVRPRFARGALMATIVLCGIDATVQCAGAVGTLKQYRTQRAVADYLRDHFDNKSRGKVFCDDGTVRVLSGVPDDRFVDSTKAPRDRESFLRFLDETGVDYLIVIETGRSTPFELFGAVKDGATIPNYDRVMGSQTSFIYTAIHVFRRSGSIVRNGQG
jgi:hypothetical protein